MSFQKVRPTIPELESLKKKKKISLKGQKLLEIKREQVFVSLKNKMQEYFKTRAVMREKLLKNYALLERLYESIGKNKLSNIAQLSNAQFEPEIDITFFTQLGVDVPRIKWQVKETHLPTYSFTDTSMHLDVLKRSAKDILEVLLKLAELDSVLYHFANTYQTIQRRINALEDNILPRLNRNIAIIEEILEDNEREEFIRLKKIKELLENKE